MTVGDRQGLVAELNDLIQLDYDAVRAYDVAIEHLESEARRATLMRFREDHLRHIRDLGALVTRYGGTPADGPQGTSGLFGLMMQHEGRIGGDRTMLLAFKANEARMRDKYLERARQAHSPDVATVLQRNARDELRHYAWAEQILVAMGAGDDSVIGTAARGAEAVQRKLVEAAEAVERAVARATKGDRRSHDSPR
jgi:rubrerythrin